MRRRHNNILGMDTILMFSILVLFFIFFTNLIVTDFNMELATEQTRNDLHLILKQVKQFGIKLVEPISNLSSEFQFILAFVWARQLRFSIVGRLVTDTSISHILLLFGIFLLGILGIPTFSLGLLIGDASKEVIFDFWQPLKNLIIERRIYKILKVAEKKGEIPFGMGTILVGKITNKNQNCNVDIDVDSEFIPFLHFNDDLCKEDAMICKINPSRMHKLIDIFGFVKKFDRDTYEHIYERSNYQKLTKEEYALLYLTIKEKYPYLFEKYSNLDEFIILKQLENT